MGLGVPYNIASYSLFTLMIAKVLGYEPGEFIHCMGDCHVYLDHVEALKGQLRREPYEFPTLDINLETVVVNERKPIDVINECIKKLENIQFKDLKLNGYQCHEKIQMSMSV
jgi:thymidylate synthase